MKRREHGNENAFGDRKVVFIHHGSVPGGAPTSLRNLLKEMRRQAPELRLHVACVFDGMLSFFAEVDGVEVTRYVEAPVNVGKKFIGWSPLLHLPSLAATVRHILHAPIGISRERKWLSRQKPDLVHLNSSTLWTSAIAARMENIPLVWHVRETLLGGRFNPRKRLYGWFIRRMADKVVAISPQDEQSLGHDNENTVTVVYNGIDFDRFRPSTEDKTVTRHQFGLPQDAFLVLTLGGFSPRKGSLQLLEALEGLPDNHHLVIAGHVLDKGCSRSGKWTEALWKIEDALVRAGIKTNQRFNYKRRLRKRLERVGHRVHQVGHTEEIPTLIEACDAVVFGGTTPHFGRPVYEAWAMEKPAIAFDASGMGDEVENERDGFVVSRDDPTELRNVLIRLSQSPELRKDIGARGRGKALARFDQAKNTHSVLEIYKTLMAAGKGVS